jgi:hypothetical protein
VSSPRSIVAGSLGLLNLDGDAGVWEQVGKAWDETGATGQQTDSQCRTNRIESTETSEPGKLGRLYASQAPLPASSPITYGSAGAPCKLQPDPTGPQLDQFGTISKFTHRLADLPVSPWPATPRSVL